MGSIGRMLGGVVGDCLEDRIRGVDDEEELDEENGVVGNVCKIAKYVCGETWLPGPGPIVRRVSIMRDLGRQRPRGRGVIDTLLRKPVEPTVGSIVCCDLAGAWEHSGVYVGRGQIIHRDGDGFLASVSPKVFLDRLGGWNNAISIYVACDKNGDPIGDTSIAREARRALRNPRLRKGYNLLKKNCHQFCRYCIKGYDDGSIANCTFSSLENLMMRNLGFTNWRTWKYD